MAKRYEIFRNELTKKESMMLAGGADSFFGKIAREEKSDEERRSSERYKKTRSGEWIEVCGKLYDARFYKGAMK